MKCSSCHDSFIDRWTLQDAWGLAAAFGDEPVEIHRYQTSTGEMARARFPLRELGDIDSQANVAARRRRVAELLTSPDNGLFSRTLVNRLWARLFGRGIVEPLDEMMEHEPWNSELLDWLASELIRQDYDVKQMLRLITTSQAYQMPAVVRTQPDESESYVFRGPEMRWLTAEQFVDSLRLLGQPPAADASPVRLPERSWQQTGSRLMTMLGRPTRDVVVSVRVHERTPLLALELINGSELEDLTMRSARIQLQSPDTADAIVTRVYSILLSRRPTSDEQRIAAGILGSPATQESLNELIWSLAMLPEFQLVP